MAVLDNYEIRAKLTNKMVDVSEIVSPEDIIFVGYIDDQKTQFTLKELKDDAKKYELGTPSTLYKAYLEAFEQGLTVMCNFKIHKIYNTYVVEGMSYKSKTTEGFVIARFNWPFIITKASTKVLLDFEY